MGSLRMCPSLQAMRPDRAMTYWALARVKAFTLAAPFFFKAFAQFEIVAPEVKISSTRRIDFPSIILGRITSKAFLTDCSRAFLSIEARCIGV